MAWFVHYWDQINWPAYVSIASAVVSVFAAIYAGRQARAAKRQADAAHGDVAPTFHTELHNDDGQTPWGFRLHVRNYNRRPLRIKRVRISVPAGLVVWDENADESPLRSLLGAAARSQAEEFFEIEKILDGVAPNASAPTGYQHDFHAGFRAETSEKRRTVHINLTIEWGYASGQNTPQTEPMSVDLPMGSAQA